MTTIATTLPEFNVLELNTLEDPHATFAEWRAAAPLVHGVVGWGVTRYADVSTLLRDRRVSSAFPREMLAVALGDGANTEFRSNSLLNRDGEDHMRLRRLMGQAFSAPLVRQLRDHVGDLVDDLLTPLLDGEEHDLVDVLAFPLPSAVICELLGIGDGDRVEVRAHAARLNSPDQAEADAAVVWFRDYMTAVLAERTADPNGRLFERMLAAAEGDDRLTHDEIIDNAFLLFLAGFDTTRHVIASAAVALCQFPDEKQLLWADPTLAASAVEEFLRFDPPLRFVPRLTVEEIEIGGRVIKPGRFLQLLLASANRDERVFDDPDRLDIRRTPNPHVGFAAGVHHCLGAMLARLELQVVFDRLARRLASVDLAGAPTRSRGLGTYAAVPVRATAA